MRRQDGDLLRVRIRANAVVDEQCDVVGSPRIKGVKNRLVTDHFIAITKAPVLNRARRS
jgi:ribosomal protein L14